MPSPDEPTRPSSDEPTLPSSDEPSAPTGRWGRYVVTGPLGAGGMGIVLAAHDPALDRKVALKLLQLRGHADDSHSQIALEAQAMARLSHPNVVTVFEVDRVGDQPFVAMELVEGSTLRGWLAERRRLWREIVEVFIAAGRGLAAAHAAGLVHRDFKPDNVLIGRDGRPRVTDFGLVRDTTATVDAPEAAGVDITTRGSAAGTPAYMSPEQWAGGPVDARGDQFAFCVALWEALWQQRPFTGATPIELRAQVTAGALVEPPARPRIPSRIAAALRRGLSVDRTARWHDMPSLLDALTRASSRRRWTAAAIAAAAAAIGSAAIAVAVVDRAPEPCAPPTARLAAVWSPAARDALAAKLAAADPAQGAARFAKIAAALDAGATSWSAMHVEACRATRVDGRQSDSLLDRRMDCLDRWLGELSDTVAVVGQAASPAAIDHATVAATALSPLSACADVRALGEAMPPPTDPARRAAAADLDRRAEQLDVELRAGQLAGLPAKVRDLVAAARPLDHPPTLATALAVRVRVDNATADYTDAEAATRELTQVAARARDDRNAAFAWSHLITTLGDEKGKLDEALAIVPMATAVVLRAGDPPELRADLLYAQASITSSGAKPRDSLAMLDEARTLLQRAGGAHPPPPLARRLADIAFLAATSHAYLSETDAAIAGFHDAIDQWRALYGIDSPDEAFGWQNLGASLQQAHKLDDALAAFQTAARIRQARLGDSAMTAASIVAVGSILSDQGKWADALPVFDRALAMQRATLAPGDIELARSLISRARALNHLDRVDDAARGYQDVVALFDTAHAKTMNLAITLDNLGELERKRGHCADAIRYDARAAALAEELRGPKNSFLYYPLVEQGNCLVHTGHPAEAIAPLTRALALPDLPTGSVDQTADVALQRSYLGRALVESGRDIPGGLAMVRAARPLIVAAGKDGADDLQELDRWLAAHH